MQQAIKHLFELLGCALSFIYPPTLHKGIMACISRIYTGYWRRHFKVLGKGTVLAFRCEQLQGTKHISIGEGVALGFGLRLCVWGTSGSEEANPVITIGNNCHFGQGNHITACNYIKIGNNLLTGSNVLITDNAHGTTDVTSLQLPPIDRPITSKGGITIGDNVWLGNNVCVMSGVKIGEGAIVGANSVVTKDISPFSIAVGCPAKVIKTLN